MSSTKRPRNLTTLAVALFTLVSLMFVSSVAVAQDAKKQVCEGVGLTGGNCDVGQDTGVSAAIAAAVNILSLLVGIVAVVMIIIGGFKYITSSGDPNNVKSAQNTILYAIVGLVAVALAQVIVRFVLKQID